MSHWSIKEKTLTNKGSDYTLSNMTKAELATAVEWAAAEGWNPGLHDADVFWNTDPNGFVALRLGSEMVGCGSIVSYDGNFGFMGFFIVRPDLRGHGLGAKLWFERRDLLLSRLKPGAGIGMDGVFAMQQFYAKGGFEFSHRNLRMEGIAGPSATASANLHSLLPSDVARIASFDLEHFGFERMRFLEGWLGLPQSFAYWSGTESGVTGYGLIRKCRQGWKVGPLFARDSETAEQLYSALTSHAAGELIYIDVPENNPEAMKLAERHTLRECFGTARMYYGSAPQLPWNEIFGITTYELG